MRPVHCSLLACLFGGRLRAGILGIRVCAAISSAKSQNFEFKRQLLVLGLSEADFQFQIAWARRTNMVSGSWRSTMSWRRTLFRLGRTLLGDHRLKEFFIWEFKILPLYMSRQLGVKKISIFLWWLLTCGASDGLTRRMLVSHWEGWDWSELNESCGARSEWLTYRDKPSAKSKIVITHQLSIITRVMM